MKRTPTVSAARAILAAHVAAGCPPLRVPIERGGAAPETETAEPFTGSALSRT